MAEITSALRLESFFLSFSLDTGKCVKIFIYGNHTYTTDTSSYTEML